MRALRPFEVVIAISLSGSVLAVAAPAFVKNLHASRLSEAMDGLSLIGERATALAERRGLARAYPASAPRTPAEVPTGESVEDPEGTWEHPTWKELGFRQDHAHYFSFSFESKNGEERSWFVAKANGDLDGDGLLSEFQLRGEWVAGGRPELFPHEILREVE